MAQSQDDIKYGAAQARLSEDEMLRVRCKHGIPLEGGKIADSEPVDLFVDARRIARRRMTLLVVEKERTRIEQPGLPALEVM